MDEQPKAWWEVLEEVGETLAQLVPSNERLAADLIALSAGLLGERISLSDERSKVLHTLGKTMRERLHKAAKDQTLQAQQATRIAGLNKRAVRTLRDLQRMNPEDFEYWVARYFKRQHFREVVVTQFSHDMGIDLYMKTPRGQEAVAQVKRYHKPVGRPVVQQTLGAMIEVGAKRCYIVTNSTFSREAMEVAAKLPRTVYLIDGAQLLSAA